MMGGFYLALGGGSLRGATHIGVLQVLLENHYHPELIVGTSAGSIVGALYAAGYNPPEISSMLVHEIRQMPDFQAGPDNTALGLDLVGKALPLGLIPGFFLGKLIAKAVRNLTFDALKQPLAVVATNLYNGEIVVFTSSKLIPDRPPHGYRFISNAQVHEAVMASIAIPGVFHPQQVDNLTLVDGGVVSNVPADVAKLLGAGKVIAVDLGFAVEETNPFNNFFQVLLQTFDIMGQRVSNMVTGQYADLTLRPRVGSANLWDFAKIPGFVAQGKLETQKELPRIKALLD